MSFFLNSQFSIPYSFHEQRLVFSIHYSQFTIHDDWKVKLMRPGPEIVYYVPGIPL